MYYLSLRLSVLILLSSTNFAFELQVPSNIAVFESTLFSWIWNNTDPELIGIMVENRSRCFPTLQLQDLDLNRVVVQKIDLVTATKIGNDRMGTARIWLNIPGQIFLCAYSYQWSLIDQQAKNLTLVASSTNITVVNPPSQILPTYTIVNTMGSSITSTSTALSNNHPARPVPLPGIIAGAVLGGVTTTLFVMIGSCIYQQKRKKGQHQPPVSEPTISPFLDYNPHSQRIMKQKAYHQECTAGGQTPVSQVHVHGAQDDPSAQLEGTSNEGPYHGQRERQTLYHNDSRWRPSLSSAPSDSSTGTSSTIVEEMSPTYEAAS
ncbi:hypothetical protein Moror_17919 [Moniliophthora roreri MCA 2997]|uniref:Mid2 domain-containing protein n=1 Tax=Moniliophthora roreri (strain MCA 2997) TaxID=1381753 RepID=V2YZS6_MONRO|nr:hypothetical protein Moror_17919 [Moniliophthora roreri MCA 2997]